MGSPEAQFVSLTAYADHPVINCVIMSLIVIGGIGFLTWEDISTNKWHIKRYRMQTKIILVTTSLLIALPAVFFFFHEFAAFPLQERILSSLFQSITPRTAGFNTRDLTAMSGAGQSVLILLMIIGGSPGSTAGGMKTTTFAVLLGNAWSVFFQKNHIQFFGRRIDGKVVRNASTILMMYILLFLSGGWLISVIENLPMSACLYETASAVGTVGLTLGITPSLTVPSQIILILLMYLGRVGGLTLIYAALSEKPKNVSKYPLEQITVG